MLARLGHHALRRRRSRAVPTSMPPTPASMFLMKRSWPGHVDDADLAPARQRQPGKTKVDGHPAFLFFTEPVGVDARQGADERGLTVIHVAGGAYDVQLHPSRARRGLNKCTMPGDDGANA